RGERHSMTNKASVLIVEDDAGAREALRMILKTEFNVLIAENGTEALQILEREAVDTVTLEPRLRGIQGRELLSLIRDKNPQIPVILVTGHRLSRWFDDMIREEIFDYIPKPFDKTEVLTAVLKSVRRRGALSRPACS